MDNVIIDEKTKTYLMACMVTGVDVTYDKVEFMNDLVPYLNKSERLYWATGDEDGIIVSNKSGEPLLLINYTGTRLTFRVFEEDEMTHLETRKDTALLMLHIIGFMRELNLEFCPSILGSERLTAVGDDNSDTNPQDWAM